MQIIIYRDRNPSRFYLWKNETECEDIQKEYKSLLAEHPTWEIELINSTEPEDILSFIKKK